jgi:CheY-like chemotaxis protein/anti-sigma regulatory factor (Ser/Thr protein kinase)
VLVPRRSAVALAPLLQRIERELTVAAQERGLQFLVRPTDLVAETDPVLFERIVRNLVSNALRYTPTGTVLVACRRRAGAVRVEVRDSGVGIAPESQAEIFKEFVQLANPEQDRRKGLGLGLAIVDRLTRLLGHQIDLRSAPGRGSVFAVTAARATPGPDALTVPGEGAPRLMLSVALLEDDELVRRATGSLLRRWGCTVHSAESADELLREWPRDLPMDFILSDFRLREGRTGFQEILRLRGWAGREVPAAVISGDTILAQDRPGDVVLLAKPLRAAALRSLLARRQARSGP